MGGFGNGAAEEDWRWGLKPGAAAIFGRRSRSFGGERREGQAVLKEKREDQAVLGKKGEDHVALVE